MRVDKPGASLAADALSLKAGDEFEIADVACGARVPTACGRLRCR